MPTYNHIGQVVTDLGRARRFYEEVLGFRFWYEMTLPDEPSARLLGLEPPLGARTAYLVLDGFVLELIQFSARQVSSPERPRTMGDLGLTHLSVSVEDIEATARRVVEYGGRIVEESNVGVALFVRDPDGQLLELLSSGYPSSRPPRPPG